MNNSCFYRHNTCVSFNTFCLEIESARQQIALQPCKNVLLFQSDSYKFTVLLFALILEQKHVLLPPNQQMGTLQLLINECDATAGEITLQNKTYLSIDTDNVKSNAQIITSVEQLFSAFTGNITFFTSGSTGQSKAIHKSCQQLCCELNTLSEVFLHTLAKTALIVSTVSHQHIYGLLFKILLPLRLGKMIVNTTFEYPEHINTQLTNISTNQSTILPNSVMLVSSPAHLKRLVLDNVLTAQAPYYGATFSSGGLLAPNISLLFSKQMNITPIEVYGSTETGGIAWRSQLSGGDTPWQVFPNIAYEVFSDGRLNIYSPYVNEQPYLTDDRVQAIDAQSFILKGRADRTIKIEEKRVNLAHIEQCLLTHSWVTDVQVIISKSANRITERQILACVMVITEEAKSLINLHGKKHVNDKLKQYLLNDFEPICLPKKWRYVDEFPYNSQGKLVLSELERLFD